MTLAEIFDLLTRGGLLGGALGILWAGQAGKWVWGWVHRQMLADQDAAHAREVAVLQEAHRAALAERDAQIAGLRAEKESLWQFALKATGILDRTTEAASRGVSAAALLARRPPGPEVAE